MPDGKKPNPRPRPAADPGFEVVDDEPAAKPAPKPAHRPVARPAPPASKSAPPPAAKPAPKPAPKPAFEVVDDDDTVVEEQAKKDTGLVPRTPARAARDDEDDDRPRKKKPKKKGRAVPAVDPDEELRERRLKEFEYIWPGVILVLGMGMAFTGAIGSSGAGGLLTVVIMIAGLLFSIPFTVATLMVVGVVAGINYGRFGPAVVKIAAITFVVNGVYFLGAWFKLPIFVVGPIGCAVAFGLFKALFDLDHAETNTSMGALNVLSWLTKLALLFAILYFSGKRDRDDFDPDDGPAPTDTRPAPGGKGPRWQQQQPPAMDPDDGPDTDDEP